MSLLHLPYSDPLIAHGYAAHASESAYPELWDGLIGAWVPALGVQGNMLYDLSGYGRHGTLTNMDPATDWVATERGHALDFDGSNDYVGVPSFFNPSSSDFSFMAWVFLRTEDTTNLSNCVFAQNDGGGTGRAWLVRNSSNESTGPKRLLSGLGGGSPTFLTGTIDFELNTWYHVALTYSVSTLRMYLDAREDASATKTVESSVGDFQIGRHKLTVSGRQWDGFIHDVRLYSRALSAAEIALSYAVSLAPFQLQPRLVWMGSAAGTPMLGQSTFRFRHDDGSLIAPEA